MTNIGTEPEIIKYNDYNTIIITMLTDSSGDRNEAERIINDRLDLKQAIIDCTKDASSTISSLSTGLFKMLTKIPGIYYSDEYYVEKFLDKFFPITPEDVEARKRSVVETLDLLVPQFDRIKLSDELDTRTNYIRDGYYQLMCEVLSISNVFLTIRMEPSILKESAGHLPARFLDDIFTRTVRTHNNDVNNIPRLGLPEQKSYLLISTLYEIATKNPYVIGRVPDETMVVIEKWLCDNEPPVNHVKSASKIV